MVWRLISITNAVRNHNRRIAVLYRIYGGRANASTRTHARY